VGKTVGIPTLRSVSHSVSPQRLFCETCVEDHLAPVAVLQRRLEDRAPARLFVSILRCAQRAAIVGSYRASGG
jgi:hypothetical protein